VSNISTSEKLLFNQLKQEMTQDGNLLYVGRLLERAAKKFGTKTALICNGYTISFTHLYRRVRMFSNTLRLLDLKPRNRVILFFENSIEFYIAYFAVLQAGGVIVPLNTLLHDKELLHIIKDARPKLLIINESCEKRLKAFENKETFPPIVTEKDVILGSALKKDDLHFDPIIDLKSEELAVLLYTSGTTGMPKGVMLSSKNIMSNVLQSASRIYDFLKPTDKIFGVLPLFHSFSEFSCIWGAFYFGCTVILVSKVDRRHILRGISYKPTIFVGVPALYGLLCLLKTVQLDSVRYFISGGDALPDKIRCAFALLYRRKICSGYGLTETSPVLSVEIEDRLGPANRVGPLLTGIQAQIRDEHGQIVPDDQIGELWVKGDNVMLGYYRSEEATKSVLQDGWFRTGDLVYFDQEGKLIIAGRLKDLIIHKGFNIYPQEIENIIMTHPAIIRIAVIGRYLDGSVEEIPVAYAQVRTLYPELKKELKQVCKTHLATYKIPRLFVLTTKELPLTATGKIHKKELKKLILQDKL
jgi:long-chain acyl-CoA synthetase